MILIVASSNDTTSIITHKRPTTALAVKISVGHVALKTTRNGILRVKKKSQGSPQSIFKTIKMLSIEEETHYSVSMNLSNLVARDVNVGKITHDGNLYFSVRFFVTAVVAANAFFW